jgi:rubrerythrin
MVSKKELLKMLHEAISMEEHVFVVDYAKYFEFVGDEGVRKLLNKLIRDSRYHALALGEIITEVEESEVEGW